MSTRMYVAVDLKSFYASVECMDAGYDPLKTNLVVADVSRTEKTICLAVSPSLKSIGIPGRARLFEVIEAVRRENAKRRAAYGRELVGESCDADELAADPSLALSFHAAPPRMRTYMEYSARIYSLYLRYIAKEDIHVYSIDEVLMDVTNYLDTYGCTAADLAKRFVREIYEATGITATAGVGTNLYLAKVAMDVGAKHVEPDEDGVRICCLDERSYRETLWTHTPLTDFWRIGRKTAAKLAGYGILTMGDVALTSLHNPDLLYTLFGVNAELLIDHSFGYEPCTMEAVKNYRPENESLTQGQVLHCGYTQDKALIVVREMADAMQQELVAKGLETDRIVLTVGYDGESADLAASLDLPVETDWYGKAVPKAARGTKKLASWTDSPTEVTEGTAQLFLQITDARLLVRRMYLACPIRKKKERAGVQLSLIE